MAFFGIWQQQQQQRTRHVNGKSQPAAMQAAMANRWLMVFTAELSSHHPLAAHQNQRFFLRNRVYKAHFFKIFGDHLKDDFVLTL